MPPTKPTVCGLGIEIEMPSSPMDPPLVAATSEERTASIPPAPERPEAPDDARWRRRTGRRPRRTPLILHRRFRVAGGRRHSNRCRQRVRHRIVHTGLRIERARVPVAGTPGAGRHQRGLAALGPQLGI